MRAKFECEAYNISFGPTSNAGQGQPPSIASLYVSFRYSIWHRIVI